MGVLLAAPRSEHAPIGAPKANHRRFLEAVVALEVKEKGCIVCEGLLR